MTRRDRNMIAVVLVLATIAASWLLVISPKRDQASKLAKQITGEQTQLTSARSEIAAGEAAKSSFASNYAAVARLGEAVPADDDVPSLIYQLQSAASATNVDFRSLQVSGNGASAAAASTAKAPTLPPGVTVGAAGFPLEPFAFTFTGNFFHLAAFFGRLQKFVTATDDTLSVSGRLLTLNAISLAPGPNGFPQITATIGATTFLLPKSQGLTAGATPSGPAPQSAQTVSTTPASNAAAPAVVSAP
jgi:hypothetical protein